MLFRSDSRRARALTSNQPSRDCAAPACRSRGGYQPLRDYNAPACRSRGHCCVAHAAKEPSLLARHVVLFVTRRLRPCRRRARRRRSPPKGDCFDPGSARNDARKLGASEHTDLSQTSTRGAGPRAEILSQSVKLLPTFTGLPEKGGTWAPRNLPAMQPPTGVPG